MRMLRSTSANKGKKPLRTSPLYTHVSSASDENGDQSNETCMTNYDIMTASPENLAEMICKRKHDHYAIFGHRKTDKSMTREAFGDRRALYLQLLHLDRNPTSSGREAMRVFQEAAATIEKDLKQNRSNETNCSEVLGETAPNHDR